MFFVNGGIRWLLKLKQSMALIDISNSVIATVVGGAATSNYGVVGMASKNALRDGAYTILNRENYRRGVVIKTNDNQIVVDVYIIVGYGLKNFRSKSQCTR